MLINIMFLLGIVIFSLLLCTLLIYYQQEQKSEIIKESNIYELFFWSVTCCFLECTVFTLIFALGSVYSLLSVTLIIWFQIVCLFIGVLKKLKKSPIKTLVTNWKLNKVILLLLIISSILYFLFPTEYLWARRDPALYLIKGINIAQTGSVNFSSNDYLNNNYETIKEFTDLNYRGVYSEFDSNNSKMPGDIVTQFLDFFPAALAIGYSIAGLEGLFRVNGLIGILCILAIYYFCNYSFNKKVATIATVFITFCPAQLWCARITQTELLYQLCWLLGVYTFGVGWRKDANGYAILTGSIIGFIGLNRIDSYVLGVGIFAVAIYCNLFIQKKSRFSMYVVLSYSITAVISLFYSYTYSFYYTVDHWKVGVLSAIIYLNTLMFIISIITFFIGKKYSKLYEKFNVFYIICNSSKRRLITCCLLFLIIRLVYYARPLLQKGKDANWDFNQRSLMEFCWYTSVAVIPLIIVSTYFLMKDENKRRELLLFIATGLCSVIVYIWKPSVAPDHIWASRRWVSTCFPFIFILAAQGINMLLETNIFKKHTTKIIQIVITFSISFYLLFQCRLFLFTPMYSELQEQYKVLIENMEEDQVYFAKMSHYASILRFVYGKDVYVLKEDSTAAIAEYTKNTGKAIYYIGDESFFDEKVSYKKIYNGNIKGTYLDEKNGKYPTELMLDGAETSIYLVWKSEEKFK